MKTEILSLLRDSKESISGQELCERFHVSRTAVWKVIKQLKEEGYAIEAVQNKGYRLVETPDVLSKEELVSSMHTKWAGQSLFYYPETGSTNLDIKQLAETGASHGTLAVADAQTAGRGRRGRKWQSPQGTSIYMSILLRPQMSPEKAPMLTILMALSVTRALHDVLVCREMKNVADSGSCAEADSDGQPVIGIKWPNDVLLNNKKICGILTEMSLEGQDIQYVVIGTGINVNTQDFPEEIAEIATSIRKETGRNWKRAEIVVKVMDYFEQYYDAFEKEQDLGFIKDEYESYLVNMDRSVRVLDPQGEFEGISRGIDHKGELLVERENGEITNVFAGEVSVRGIYGYVL